MEVSGQGEKESMLGQGVTLEPGGELSKFTSDSSVLQALSMTNMRLLCFCCLINLVSGGSFTLVVRIPLMQSHRGTQ